MFAFADSDSTDDMSFGLLVILAVFAAGFSMVPPVTFLQHPRLQADALMQTSAALTSACSLLALVWACSSLACCPYCRRDEDEEMTCEDTTCEQCNEIFCSRESCEDEDTRESCCFCLSSCLANIRSRHAANTGEKTAPRAAKAFSLHWKKDADTIQVLRLSGEELLCLIAEPTMSCSSLQEQLASQLQIDPSLLQLYKGSKLMDESSKIGDLRDVTLAISEASFDPEAQTVGLAAVTDNALFQALPPQQDRAMA